jgi:preprotein translocase subunit YajC
MSDQIMRISLALAPPAAQSGQQNMPFWANLFPIILLFVVFYFALIRPQQKKAREHSELMKTLKPGDKVLTSGGIIGVIVALKDKSLSIRSSDTKFEILRSAVTEIIEKSTTGNES